MSSGSTRSIAEIAAALERRVPRALNRSTPPLGGSPLRPYHWASGKALLLPSHEESAHETASDPDGAFTLPRNAVLARLDLETTIPFSRPRLETRERGRDFLFTDGTGLACVQVTAGDERLHPDVELQLGAPFRSFQLPTPTTFTDDEELLSGATATTAYLRTLQQGEAVYVFGRPRLAGIEELAGALPESIAAAAFTNYREPPRLVLFSGEEGPLRIHDAVSYQQLAAWSALPWYRKLSVLVRNR